MLEEEADLKLRQESELIREEKTSEARESQLLSEDQRKENLLVGDSVFWKDNCRGNTTVQEIAEWSGNM